MNAKRCTYPPGLTIAPGGIPLEPCAYEEVEVHRNVTVRVLRCTRCGHVEVEWERQPDTETVYDAEWFAENTPPSAPESP